VYPAPELGALWAALGEAGLVPKRIRAVHAEASLPARVLLVEACPGKPGGLCLEPPLFEREDKGYSEEMQRLLEGRSPTLARA
jgi:tRNA1(Val) A37 N6-methylase TrmN6